MNFPNFTSSLEELNEYYLNNYGYTKTQLIALKSTNLSKFKIVKSIEFLNALELFIDLIYVENRIYVKTISSLLNNEINDEWLFMLYKFQQLCYSQSQNPEKLNKMVTQINNLNLNITLPELPIFIKPYIVLNHISKLKEILNLHNNNKIDECIYFFLKIESAFYKVTKMTDINYSFEDHSFENLLLYTIKFNNMLIYENDKESSKTAALNIVLQLLRNEIYLRVWNASG